MEDIINIGKSCINLGVKEVVISAILPKNNIALTRLIRFGFITNDNISRTCLWKDGYLEDLGTNILAGNFADFLNRFTLSKSSEYL